MIVDDEKSLLESLSERLGIRDYDVTTSCSGEDALKQVRRHNFDVVILDVLMPGIDGVEALREIKSIKPLTQVIMLTGHATVETAVKAMESGALGYLMKPCDMDKMLSLIDKACEKRAEQADRIRKAKASLNKDGRGVQKTPHS